MNSRFLRLFIVGLASVALSGCGTSKPFELWQNDVDLYVKINGNGDIMCLRNTDPEVARPIFEAEKGSTLAKGVLVGCEEADSRLWWVYIVAASQSGALRDVRAVAVSEEKEELTFASSVEDQQAFEAYLNYRMSQWRQYRTDEPDKKSFVAVFPGPTDAFSLSGSLSTLIITEQNSGAQWSIAVGEAALAASE